LDLLASLTDIGLTEYEAKVYLALLREHPATGYQLSKLSGVPRSMVYTSLKRLATLYRPLPPDMLLDRHEAEHQALVEGLRRGLSAHYTASVDNHVWSINGRPAALSYAGQLICEAQRELFLVLTDEDVLALYEQITAACERDVEVNTLLTGEAMLDCGRVAFHPPLESELQELTTTLLVAQDDREVLIASASARQETTATITRNADLVLIARQFVWMELFAQRIYARLGSDLLERLEPQDRRIFESLAGQDEGG
jgi:sugar-specific transcriptional regulator TrmB